MLNVHNFAYGVLTPSLAYLMSCLGAFLGLRCTTRAQAYEGSARIRWLLLGGVSIGTTGIWVMHFIAMLGFSVPGRTITYNVPITILSMFIAVVIVCIGLLIVGLSKPGVRPLLLGGTVTGLGVASMHYTGMAAMRMPGKITYDPALFGISVVIAIVAATAALWAAHNLHRLATTLGAALIMGVAVSGMHYTGMAAMRMYTAAAPSGMVMGGSGGATAENFLLPLILGISILAFVLTATLALSPTGDEIREDAELMARIGASRDGQLPVREMPLQPTANGHQARPISRAAQERRLADRDGSLSADDVWRSGSAGGLPE
jgi:NO-binding membrane sensor protein with MHYT domain